MATATLHAASAAPASSSGWTVVGRGGVWGATATMIYAAIFGLYAAVRAAAFVWQAGPARLGPDLFAFDIALLYLALMFGVQLLLVAVPLGMITALLIWMVLRLLPHPGWTAALVGVVVSLAICAAIGYYLPTVSGDRMSPTAYPATFWFWLGVPGMLYVVTAAFGAVRLGKRMG